MPLEELGFPAERQVGFWKTKDMPDQQVGIGVEPMPGSNLVASSPLERLLPIGTKSVDWMELPQAYLARGPKENLYVGLEATANLSKSSWNSTDDQLKSQSTVYMQPASYSLGGNRSGINGTLHESSLFSSSLSDIYSRKLRVSENDVRFCQPANAVCEDGEPFESLKEIEAQTIGNLLPDEDDLFSGVLDEPRYNVHTNNSDELEDFDLFSSGGGMELEGDARLCAQRRNSVFISGISNDLGVINGSTVGEHPYGEHPSRTLFVRNINSNIEDSELKDLFEQYGDIRTLYTACKHRGFVMISYYDLRAAQNAMRVLQNKPLRSRKLDIHFSIPKDNPPEKDINQGTLVIFNLDASVSNDNLHQIFGVYGEIKEIRETPHKHHHKFIEFYDLRAAEAALHALNRSDIAGKQIKLEPSRPGGARRLKQPNELDQDPEPNLSQSPCDNSSSGTGYASRGIMASSCIDNGSVQGLHSVIRSPLSTFIENVFPHQSTSVSNTLPSPVRVAPIGNQFGLHEPNLSVGEMKFCNQQSPSLHPHSFPEYHENSAKGIPYNASSSITNLASFAGMRLTEGTDNRHIQGVSSNGHSMEFNGGVFGSSGNGNGLLHGHNYTWSNPNSYQHHPPSPMMWSNSPSFANGVHTRRPQLPGLPRAPLHLANTGSPIHHHVGSAPSVNPTMWDRQLAFTGESPDASSFHLGSLGSVGFPGASPLHHSEVASRNIFGHVGGNFMDMTANTAPRSSQQLCSIFPGKNPMISMPASFDYPNERMRNLSHRRNEANSNYADKKQYELDIDRIFRGDDSRTTLMIKNIPNKYTSKMLLAAIDENCRGTYDFIYLPIDFKNKCNVGYAFINMIDPKKIVPLHQAFNGKKWEKFNSEKVATLAYARIQGKGALIAHFQNSSLMNEDKRCRPILFHTDGPNAGDQEPFPMGTSIRSRPGKPRTSGVDENLEGNSSISVYGEESSAAMDASSGSSKDSD